VIALKWSDQIFKRLLLNGIIRQDVVEKVALAVAVSL
jgi:hypothetical protein